MACQGTHTRPPRPDVCYTVWCSCFSLFASYPAIFLYFSGLEIFSEQGHFTLDWDIEECCPKIVFCACVLSEIPKAFLSVSTVFFLCFYITHHIFLRYWDIKIFCNLTVTGQWPYALVRAFFYTSQSHKTPNICVTTKRGFLFSRRHVLVSLSWQHLRDLHNSDLLLNSDIYVICTTATCQSPVLVETSCPFKAHISEFSNCRLLCFATSGFCAVVEKLIKSSPMWYIYFFTSLFQFATLEATWAAFMLECKNVLAAI